MRFLIVKMSAFGDIIHAWPVVHFLKEHVPGCRVDWVVEKRMASLVTEHPLVDRVIAIDTKGMKRSRCPKKLFSQARAAVKELRAQEYDVLFDLQANSKSGLISFFARAGKKVGFGFKTAAEWINPCFMNERIDVPKGCTIRDDYLYIVKSFFKKEGLIQERVQLRLTDYEKSRLEQFPQNSWLVCPGSNWPNKKLSDGTLKRFLQALSDRYSPSFVFLCGTADEKREAEQLAALFQGTILEKPPLALLQHCMAKSQVVISMDSMPLHLACTTDTPTFSVFGPSSRQKYGPLASHHVAIQGSCPYNQKFEKRCKKLRTCPTGACIGDIDVDELLEQFARLNLRVSSKI